MRTPTEECSRKVEQIHGDELGLAVVMLLRDVAGATRAEVIQSVARIFGWTRTGAIVDRRMGEVIDRLVLSERVVAGADETLAVVR